MALLDLVLTRRQTLDEALAAHPLGGSDADNKFTRLLVLTVLRHIGQIDALLAGYLETKLPPKRQAVTQALRLGVAQLLLLNTPAHAAVHETVEQLKRGKDAGLAGLVNAVLQKVARERPVLPPAEYNLPSWLKGKWRAQYGAEAVTQITVMASQRPPLDLNQLEGDQAGTRLDTQIVRLPAEHAAVEMLAGYEEGAFFVQDVAASYPARMLGDVRDRQVLDLCAAPGGKTMQLIRAGGFVTALDRSPARMKRVKENLARLGMQANLVAADALEWVPNRPYDAILLDAPCSATGTWRRHPEVVHHVTPDAMAELVALQRALLARAWEWVKPGGRMVYCVCSLEREEGEEQAAWFAAAQANAQLVPVDASSGIVPEAITREGYLRTLPGFWATHGGMDGFFAVCFEKV